MGFLRKYYITLLVIVIAILALSDIFSKKENTSKENKAKSEISQNDLPKIQQEVYSFRVEGFNKNKKVQWGLEGESANVVLDKVNMSNLKAVYYGDDTTFTLFADRAVYDKKSQNIELRNNIVGRSSDGGELITDYAKWTAKTEKITTDSYVVVKRENIVCKGRGLITKPQLKWAEFERDIEVDFSQDRKIVCDGPFEIDLEKSIAIFNDNVKVTDKDSETFADRLTVYLNPDTNKIERVVTEGNVKVVHKGDFKDMGDISF